MKKKLKAKKTLLDGNEAAAWAARMARVDYIPNFPITPQTEMIEVIAQWIADGEMNVVFDKMDSEHSVLSAAVGASATGKRVFTASGSQGLLLMHEILFGASGMRLPIVMGVMERGLSAPITLWPDHCDLLDQRDAGWLMYHAETNQEVFDFIIQAFKVCENEKVLLPAMIGQEGYILSFTREPVELPEQKQVDRFLGEYKPKHAYFKAGEMLAQGSAAMAEEYSYHRTQQHLAAKNALTVMEKTFKAFKKEFGRSYDFVEEFKTSDAEIVLVSQGAITTSLKGAVLEARKKGIKVGILKLRVIRPFPKERIKKALRKAKAVGIIDRNLAPGLGGIMWPEIALCLYEMKSQAILSDFVLGLGGLPQPKEKLLKVITKLKEDLKKKKGRLEFNDY